MRFSSVDSADPVAALFGEIVDFGGERANFFRDLRQRVVGGDVRDDAAQRADRRFKLLQGGRIVVGSNGVDFPGQPSDCLIEADQAFGRRQRA